MRKPIRKIARHSLVNKYTNEVFQGDEDDFKIELREWQKQRKTIRPKYDVFYDCDDIEGFEIQIIDEETIEKQELKNDK